MENDHKNNVKTISLEEKFNFKIDKSLVINGRIERIDDLGYGYLEIIDYKTGANIRSQKEVDKNLQLSVYAMAFSSKYKKKPENIKLSLYFLNTQEKIVTKRNGKDLEKVKKEILKIRDEIEKSDFRCSNHYICQTGCEFSIFCNNTK